ncbi:oligosaccharide flippase family protein [Ideonella livida]|uniref:Oligosaccharide flippase family protein n=1 Tax=Ideonella livida TaxID=2707176 RepID=A0A7C9PIB3_9BURK|nr:oligosaccharide flippase family protein [Ideonella livida]NDY92508.1 oligosaccharide flippase family protein [Ideonella livida]
MSRLRAASGWMLFLQFGSQGLRFFSNLVLARLLMPDAFGLVATVNLVIIGLNLFSDIGLHNSVVVSARAVEPAFARTVWTLQVLRGLVLAGCCLALGLLMLVVGRWDALAGTTYGDPRLPAVFLALSLMPVVTGLQSVRVLLAKRELRTRDLAVLELGGQGVAFITTATLAWLTHSHWALVVGGLTGALVQTLAGHWRLPGPRDGWQLEREAMREVLGHAKWLLPASILAFLAANSDRLVLGGVVDAATLGIYSMAFLLMNAFQQIAGNLCAGVVFPALSAVQRENPQAMGATLARFQRLYDLGFVTVGSALAVCGSQVVGLLYDPRYAAAGPMLQLLAAGSIGLRSQIGELAFQALGQFKWSAAARLVQWLSLLVGLGTGLALGGVLGATLGIALSSYAVWPLVMAFNRRHGLRPPGAHRMLLPALAAGGLLGLVVRQLLWWLQG